MQGIGDVRIFFNAMSDLNTACDVRFNRNVVLKPYGGQAGDLVKKVVAGSFLAYVDDDGFHVDFHIYSVDLFSGRFAHGHYFPASPGAVSDLVLKPNGSIAWIEVTYVNGGPKLSVTLRVADKHGVRVPPSGKGVKADSLRLRGSKLTWKKGRRKFSAHLY